MSPVNEVTRQRLPELWVYDIPPRTNVGLDVTEPRIYFGEHTDQYVIVNTKTDEFDHPMGDTNAFTRYDGKDGIYLKSFLHRLAFAMRFAESRIILSTDITQESRVLFDRNIITRAQKIAPFLRYDNDPYIVLSDGRLYWIIDAYTVSNRFPYAEPTPGWGNYIRNSVKVVVDAYQGTIDFYQVESDPLLETYANIFPGWLKPQSEMPDGLLAHLRYPEDLFVTQARMYGTYHMTDTRVFYNREDVWQFAREVYAGREQEVTPYYVVMTLPGETKEEMVLMLPFIPVGRSNMIAWLGARNDGDNYGEVQIFTFPQGALTQGPAQVEARIDQDPEISQLLTLWSQGGSQVIRGNMLVLPVGESVIYVEPFYLQSDQTSMPELQRVIVSDQNETVIAQDLDSAMEIFMARLDSEFDVVPRPDSEEELLTPLDIDLTNQAFFIYNKAKDSLQAGDFAAFGEAWEELEIILEELNRL